MGKVNYATSHSYKEVRDVVADFEKHGCAVVLVGNGLFIGNPEEGLGREPLSLWERYRKCDQQRLERYLMGTGRVQAPGRRVPVLGTASEGEWKPKRSVAA